MTALSKTLKQREAEIEDFKLHFNLPVKVWSVSTDYPSNPAVNLIVRVTTENGDNYREKNSMIDSDASGSGNGNGSVGSEDRENSTQDEDSREMNGEERFQKRKNSQEGEITREKTRRFFKDESESERGVRIHDSELKRETEHQDHDVVNMTNKSVEKKGTLNISNEFQQMEELKVEMGDRVGLENMKVQLNITDEYRKQKLDEVRELEEQDTDSKQVVMHKDEELEYLEVEDNREISRVVLKKSRSKLEEE